MATIVSDLNGQLQIAGEIDEITAHVGNTMNITATGDIVVDEVIEMDGWKHVYGGPVGCLDNTTSPDSWDGYIDQDDPGGTGTEYDFDIIMIRPRLFNRIATHFYDVTMNETCTFKQSLREYFRDFFAEADTNGNRIKFHSKADGLKDVTGNREGLGYCYGNSWRRIAYCWYVNDGGAQYLGLYASQLGIDKADWGASYADTYATEAEMMNNVLTESSRGLTPRDSVMVDVYIKLGSATAFEQSVNTELNQKYEFVEGEI